MLKHRKLKEGPFGPTRSDHVRRGRKDRYPAVIYFSGSRACRDNEGILGWRWDGADRLIWIDLVSQITYN